MTAPKFTPGPWGSVIASWGDNGVCFEIEGIQSINAADAHLIAAAPELYEIVERLACDLEAEIQHRAPGELPRRIERDMAVVYEARAMLAKARGDANG